jgi:hypothetical protein
MKLLRQYAIRHLSNDEIKNILSYFNYNLMEKTPLKNAIDIINQKFSIKKQTNEEINFKIQSLQSIYITNPKILNTIVSQI